MAFDGFSAGFTKCENPVPCRSMGVTMDSKKMQLYVRNRFEILTHHQSCRLPTCEEHRYYNIIW